MEAISTLFPTGSQGAEVGHALDQRGAPGLLAGEPFDQKVADRLVSLDGELLFHPTKVKDRELAEAARAGLLLWNDSFEASHGIAQGINSTTGSYWHAVCHRREGHRGAGLQSNMGNAQYWFRRVGQHPVYESLYAQALSILKTSGVEGEELRKKGAWDPFLFVEWLQRCEESEGMEERHRLEAIQAAEMRLLIEYCAIGAIGG